MNPTAPAAAAVVKALRASGNNVMRKLEVHSLLAAAIVKALRATEMQKSRIECLENIIYNELTSGGPRTSCTGRILLKDVSLRRQRPVLLVLLVSQ